MKRRRLRLTGERIMYRTNDAAARIAKTAHEKGLTLRAAALELGAVTEEEFDRWIRPEQMVRPY